jgi:23S rRNA pseudouridine2604 synthase
MKQRINKYLAEAGCCSRRRADDLIKAGAVFINGIRAELGSRVEDGDEVSVKGQKIKKIKDSKIYIAYHKPVGVICTADQSKKDNIIDRINIKERIFPVGRLDVKSSGLILLTSDGDFANRVSHPRYCHQKEYEVETDKEITDQAIEQLKKGIKLREGLAKADKIKRHTSHVIHLTIHQGWNRQIRRMCEAIGLEVKRLKRISIGEISLSRLAVGEWRKLTEQEIKSFK